LLIAITYETYTHARFAFLTRQAPNLGNPVPQVSERLCMAIAPTLNQTCWDAR